MDPTENLAVYKTSTSKREGETVLREIQHSMAETNYLKEVISVSTGLSHYVLDKSLSAIILYNNYFFRKNRKNKTFLNSFGLCSKSLSAIILYNNYFF